MPSNQLLPPTLLTHPLYLTDGGLETTLIFREGLDLPEFAAFDLLKTPAGYQALQTYYRTYAAMAQRHNVGFILESPTWRANRDWGAKLGYNSNALTAVNQRAIALLHTVRKEYETEQSPMLVSGCIGPRGDGYVTHTAMQPTQAATYHTPQILAFQDARADLVSAMTINYVEEAIGIVYAAQAIGMPVVISFTLETDGRLPSGQTLRSAIEQVDASTGQGPAYYMINCAHPQHFDAILTEEHLNGATPQDSWLGRIRGIRANASTRSHAELDAAPNLDDGNPHELGKQHRQLLEKLPYLTVLGGCCGTDERHVEAICKACLPVLWSHLTRNWVLCQSA